MLIENSHCKALHTKNKTGTVIMNMFSVEINYTSFLKVKEYLEHHTNCFI